MSKSKSAWRLRSKTRKILEGAVHYGLVGGIFLCVMGIGGVNVQVQLLFAMLTVLLGLSTWMLSTRRFLLIHYPVLILAAIVVLELFQLVPLPRWALSLLSGEYVRSLDYLLKDFPAPISTRWRPISVDPWGTLNAVSLHSSVVLFLLVAGNYWNDRSEAARRTLGWIAILGVITFWIGLLSRFLGQGFMLGYYPLPPELNDDAFLRGSFVNANHQASFFGVASFVSLYLGVSSQINKGRAIYMALMIGAGLVSAVGVVLTLSRGGVVAFASSMVLTVLLMLFARQERMPAALKYGLPLALAGAIGFAAWTSIGDIKEEIAKSESLTTEKSDVKIAMWKSAVHMTNDFWLVGAGRGAFEHGYTRYQPGDVLGRVRFPENVFLQHWAEFGWVGGTIALMMLGSILFLAWRRTRQYPQGLMLFGAILFITIREIFDFGTERLGVAVPLFMVIVYLMTTTSHEMESRLKIQLRGAVKQMVLGGLIILVGAFAAGKFIFKARIYGDDGEQMRAGILNNRKNIGEDQVLRLIDLHPHDYFVHLLHTDWLLTANPPKYEESLATLNRAMYLKTSDPSPHLKAGYALASLGRIKQAAFEFGEAQKFMDRERRERLWNDLIPYKFKLSTWLEMFPDEPQSYLDLAEFFRKKNMENVLWSLLEKGQKKFPDHWEFYVGMADIRRSKKDIFGAEALYQLAIKKFPEQGTAYAELANMYYMDGRKNEAVRLLEEGLSKARENRLKLLLQRAYLAMHEGNADIVDDMRNKAIAEKLLDNTGAQLDFLTYKGHAYLNAGKYGAAVKELQIIEALGNKSIYLCKTLLDAIIKNNDMLQAKSKLVECREWFPDWDGYQEFQNRISERERLITQGYQELQRKELAQEALPGKPDKPVKSP
ncbi:MAG: hypothetical protein GMKNLPBB_03013 [Myxococcota bacterium]|nr:hypothetical protein [Myxococcota bacterium]